MTVALSTIMRAASERYHTEVTIGSSTFGGCLRKRGGGVHALTAFQSALVEADGKDRFARLREQREAAHNLRLSGETAAWLRTARGQRNHKVDNGRWHAWGVRANHSAGVAEIFGRPGLPLGLAASSKYDWQFEREALRSAEWPRWISLGLIHHLRRKNKYTQARTAEFVPQDGPLYLRWTCCLFVALAEVTLLFSVRNGKL